MKAKSTPSLSLICLRWSFRSLALSLQTDFWHVVRDKYLAITETFVFESNRRAFRVLPSWGYLVKALLKCYWDQIRRFFFVSLYVTFESVLIRMSSLSSKFPLEVHFFEPSFLWSSVRHYSNQIMSEQGERSSVTSSYPILSSKPKLRSNSLRSTERKLFYS